MTNTIIILILYIKRYVYLRSYSSLMTESRFQHRHRAQVRVLTHGNIMLNKTLVDASNCCSILNFYGKKSLSRLKAAEIFKTITNV